MKAATINELKKELDLLDARQLRTLCLRLSKFKKDNKELLTYLLFESSDEQAYINDAKQEMTEQFDSITNLTVYYIKKSIRRILRIVNKQIKYSGIPTTELALRIHFCSQMKESAIPIKRSAVLENLYNQQVKKIKVSLAKLEPDLQYDYQSDIENLIL